MRSPALKPQPRPAYLHALEEAATALDDLLREVEELRVQMKTKARAQRAMAAVYQVSQ